MKTVDWDASEKGRQRRIDVTGRLLHCCCVCGKLDRWGDGWSYYGSYKELEDCVPVPKFCSEPCRDKGGLDARNITNEMKAKAKDAEWREPKLAYREMTGREKYRAVLDAQKP